ncbi:MAG: histone deacetylase, partial [Nitrospinota bacterium]
MIPFVFSPEYTLRLWGLERLHPFDARKFQRIRDALVAEGLRRPGDFAPPEPLDREALLRVHEPAYLESLSRPSVLGRILELPFLSLLPRSVAERKVLGVFLRVTGGTVTAARLALERGLAVNLGGGYHHAFRDRGHGFCAVNDIAVAIRDLQARGLIRRALVVDADLHQGDGTAAIFQDDPKVFTLSVHEEENFPFPKMRSDLDVGLPSGVGDADYLAALEGALEEAEARFSP